MCDEQVMFVSVVPDNQCVRACFADPGISLNRVDWNTPEYPLKGPTHASHSLTHLNDHGADRDRLHVR